MKNDGGAHSRRSTGPFQCRHQYSSIHDLLEEVMLLYLLGGLLLAHALFFMPFYFSSASAWFTDCGAISALPPGTTHF